VYSNDAMSIARWFLSGKRLDAVRHFHQRIELIVACVGEAEADDAVRVEHHPVASKPRHVRDHVLHPIGWAVWLCPEGQVIEAAAIAQQQGDLRSRSFSG